MPSIPCNSQHLAGLGPFSTYNLSYFTDHTITYSDQLLAILWARPWHLANGLDLRVALWFTLPEGALGKTVSRGMIPCWETQHGGWADTKYCLWMVQFAPHSAHLSSFASQCKGNWEGKAGLWPWSSPPFWGREGEFMLCGCSLELRHCDYA